jgi:hypothetical protein
MTKICFAWGIALVATLGLLGMSLAYPSGGPVGDDESAQVVGGAGPCACYSLGYCNQTGCANQLYFGRVSCSANNVSGINQMPCGDGSACLQGWEGFAGCVSTTMPAP